VAALDVVDAFVDEHRALFDTDAWPAPAGALLPVPCCLCGGVRSRSGV